MKRSSATLLAILLVLSGHAVSSAITLELEPAAQDVVLGTPVEVAVVISGLGAGTAPSLSTFELDVTFEPAFLAFSGVVYGDPVLGDQLDLLGLGSLTATTPGAGAVNLFELSLDDTADLDGLQADTFTLAVLTFDTLAVGPSLLGISVVDLGDALGEPLAASVVGGAVTVVPRPTGVPGPDTIILMGAGILTLLGRRWRRTNRHRSSVDASE